VRADCEYYAKLGPKQAPKKRPKSHVR
jgi:hypothetical protein